MDSLTRLQVINLFKKYDYYLTEFQFKNEISIVSHNLFQENVKKVLSEFKKEEEKSEDKPDDIQNKDRKDAINAENNDDQTDAKLKVLYRKIVKETHPDKVNNSYLNNLYIEATEALESNNELAIFRICVILNIEFDLPENIADMIDKEVTQLRHKISFLESSYHMKWHNSPKSEKNDILVNYLMKSLKLFEV
jgi:hypothetical protein